MGGDSGGLIDHDNIGILVDNPHPLHQDRANRRRWWIIQLDF
jgi:hypothetical protein